ncbi:MAG: restriction endonuclease subunit S [Gallionellaceae bacterium]|nr:restriction endonuclease subunit S [Gallionellaceae bacterium]
MVERSDTTGTGTPQEPHPGRGASNPSACDPVKSSVVGGNGETGEKEAGEMRYPAYPQYVPTRWLEVGQIPAGWEARRLKFAATCNDEALPETTDPDYEMSYVDISSVDLVNGITTVETHTFEAAPSRARRIVRNGDTIVSTVRTYLKAIAFISTPLENMIVSTGFAVIRPFEFIDSRFLGYALQSTSFIDGVVAHSAGVSYPAINPSSLVCLPVAYPTDKAEQKQIAAFLDWKTGQIDALIAKGFAITRLTEYRAALITAATSGKIDVRAFSPTPPPPDGEGRIPTEAP